MKYSPEVTETIHLQDAYTLMYGVLAGRILADLGDEGESALREALRRYGRGRGLARRREHLRMGVKINMRSLRTVSYDRPPDPRFRRDWIVLNDEERTSRTLACPMAEVWSRNGMKDIGRIYCEEFHKACYREYAFGLAEVFLGATLTEEGDSYCDFHVLLRRANVPERLQALCFADRDPGYEPPRLKETQAESKPGFSALCIRLYCSMAEVLRERFPERMDGVFREGLAAWAEISLKNLSEQAKEARTELTPDFAQRHFPLYLSNTDEPLWRTCRGDTANLARATLDEFFYSAFLPSLFSEGRGAARRRTGISS